MTRLAVFLLICFTSLASVNAFATPRDSENACLLLREQRGWYKDLVAAEKRWKVESATILAVIYQESAFRAHARPAGRKRFLFFFPGGRKSTAYGYAQVKDETWNDYRKRAQRPRARRSKFRDASDFVAYYLDWISRHGRVSKRNVSSLYVAYHEGLGGFKNGTWKSKPWLTETASRVQARAVRYHKQLLTCEKGPARKYKKFRTNQ